jgi:hypothetical protein
MNESGLTRSGAQRDGTALRVIYRSTGGENGKDRPSYYSKRLCLTSFLRAMRACGVEHEILFLNDGPIPPDRLGLMRAAGEVIPVPTGDAPIRQIIRTGRGGQGMAGSYVAAIALVDQRAWSDKDLVYLAEDDYLYREHAFASLVAAARAIPRASYFALYAKVEPSRSETFHSGAEPWVRAISTTSSYGARVGALRADRWIHRTAYYAPGGWIDENFCWAYQGMPPFTWRQMVEAGRADGPVQSRVRRVVLQTALNALALRAKRRPHLLVRPLVPLATHLETGVMARGTDWEMVAREAQDVSLTSP